ncbi:MAG: ABC transporter permease [Lachnospiraceae bacterium]|nr:ABC transporter permease [Lachnospiraceae bacterium]
MIRYIIKRLLLMIPVILGVTWLIFTIMYFTPGDPARIILGTEATEEEIEELRDELGLNDGYVVRFISYVKQVFVDRDLGNSYINNRSVSEEIGMRFPYTMRVALFSTILAVLIGLPLGVLSAVNQFTWKDNAAMLLALIGISMPSFWVALMLSLLFALNLGWFPASGVGGWRYYVLPCISIALTGCASIARQTRSGMLEVIRQDYVVTARAKGVREFLVIYKHALSNALIPILTQVGSMFGVQLGGAMIAETIFSIPGVGTYMVSGIKNRDYPVVQGSILYVAIVFSLVMLLVDLMYAFVDPRIRAQYQGKSRKKKAVQEEGGAVSEG